MGPSKITPAALVSRDGAPFNDDYGDLYASRDGALGQARHVFLGGNDLPRRWRGRDQFVILETGFGLGVNFLATWQAWRDDPQRPRRLHFVSVELHPVRAAHLVEAAPAALQSLAAALSACWPLPLPGLHRLAFDADAVTLTLALGDARALLPQLELGADAIYLDGFAPERNPALWEPALLRAVARLARPGATASTYTAARGVRDALAGAGFEIALRPGFGRKRQMLAARFAPRWQVRRHEPAPAYAGERRALVIGAGLAGAHCADALWRRGWRVEVVDACSTVAAGASALPWGLLHPHLSADDNLASRLARAGFLFARQRLAALPEYAADASACWRDSGVLQQARSPSEAEAWAAQAAATGWPDEYASFAPAAALAARLGVVPRHGGWWFARGATVAAGAWCRALLEARSGIDLRLGRTVERLPQRDGLWQAIDGRGQVIAQAPVVVLANALDAPRLAGAHWLPVQPVRGRISYLDAPALRGLAAGLIGDGYLVHAPDGTIGAGASYEWLPAGAGDAGALDAEQVHRGNLQRLERLLAAPVAARITGVYDGVRAVAPDRLPYAGALADEAAAVLHAQTLRGCFALGSRGLVLAALLAERVAAQIEGEPAPVERSLAAAVDPARRLLAELRAGRVRAGAR